MHGHIRGCRGGCGAAPRRLAPFPGCQRPLAGPRAAGPAALPEHRPGAPSAAFDLPASLAASRARGPGSPGGLKRRLPCPTPRLAPRPSPRVGAATRRPMERFPAGAPLQSSWPWRRCFVAETGFMPVFLFLLLLLPSRAVIGAQEPPDGSELWGHLVQELVVTNARCTLQKREGQEMSE